MTAVTIIPAAPIAPALHLDALAASATALAANARAPNMRRAYRSDCPHCEGWCAAQGFAALPAVPTTIGLYLATHETSPSVGTLTRRLSAIAVSRRMAGFPMYTRHPAVADVMKGLRGERGSQQRYAEALTIPRLRRVLNQIESKLGDRRDRAFLLVDMAAALRRSELVALDIADMAIQPEGLRLIIRRSKSDQGSEGAALRVNAGERGHRRSGN